MKLTDEQEYTDFTIHHERSHILQSAQWGKVKAAWTNEFVLVRDENGRLKGTMSILIRKVPLFPGTFMYAPRGPVCDLHDRDTLQKLTDGAREIGKRYKAMNLKIDTDTPASDTEYAAIMKKLGYTLRNNYYNLEGVQARFLMRVDLKDKTEEELLASFHHKTRYNIRVAQKKGVEIRVGTREDIPAFFELMKTTGARDGFTTRGIDYFYRMYDCLGEYCRLFLAYAGEGEERACVSGTMAGLYGNKCLYLYGASGNRFRNYMPNYLIQWEMIRWARENGCTVYDLRGVPGRIEDENNPIYGLYRFKKGFAGQATEMIGEFDLALRPVWYRLFMWAEATNKRVHKAISRLKKKKN
ncbi:MAG: peptidoglycan bridge formation glycyltransferase FemA/FemB family protein [Clostridia bacterium]|nr:peptidoglycan bridge formation glycyltransferase FemA/FemB family protein [Clostridia bacterium]